MGPRLNGSPGVYYIFKCSINERTGGKQVKSLKKLLVSALIVLFVWAPGFAAVGDTVSKTKLSGSTSGLGILVVATATAGTLIHTATAGATNLDEIWIWAYNSHTSAVVLTIEFGGVTDPNNHIVKTIPVDDGLYLILPGIVLNGGLIVRAFASVASKIVISGYVNQMTE